MKKKHIFKTSGAMALSVLLTISLFWATPFAFVQGAQGSPPTSQSITPPIEETSSSLSVPNIIEKQPSSLPNSAPASASITKDESAPASASITKDESAPTSASTAQDESAPASTSLINEEINSSTTPSMNVSEESTSAPVPIIQATESDELTALSEDLPAEGATHHVITFAQLKTAVAGAAEDDTILIADDIQLTETITINKNLHFASAQEGKISLYNKPYANHFAIIAGAGTYSRPILSFSNIILTSLGDNYGGISIKNTSALIKGAILSGLYWSAAAITIDGEHIDIEDTIIENITNGNAINIVNGSVGLLRVTIQNISNGNGIHKTNGWGALSVVDSKIQNLASGTAIFITPTNHRDLVYLAITGSQIENNQSTSRTSGVLISGSYVIVNIKKSSISHNTFNGANLIYGAGLHVMAPINDPSTVTDGKILITVEDSDISNNKLLGGSGGWTPIGWGGAGIVAMSHNRGTRFTDTDLYDVEVTTNITRSTLNNNVTEIDLSNFYKNGGQGSAVFSDGMINVYGSSFDSNSASSNGTLSAEIGSKSGSGINIKSDPETGRATKFTNNSAGAGGAIHINYYDSSGLDTPLTKLYVENASFENNIARLGSAIYTYESGSKQPSEPKIIKNSTFVGNTYTLPYKNVPSGVLAFAGYKGNKYAPSHLVDGCTFTNNKGYDSGGAISITTDALLEVKNSAFNGNSVEAESTTKGGGGAIFLSDINKNLIGISNTTFENNSSPNPRYTATNPYAQKFTNVTATAPFTHPINNFDINYTGGTLGTIHNVDFQSNGGTPIAPIKVFFRAMLNPCPQPTKDYHSFEGWYKEAELTNIWTPSYDKVTSDITLYAKWELNKYDVQFNTLGGNTLPPILAVPHNTSIEPPDIPIYENRTFVGWYKEQSLENKWNFSTDKITSPITLYAKWELNKYDVQFNTLGGNTLPPILAVPHNTSIEPPDIPIYENHTFEGWYKEQSLENKWNFSTDKITSPITLYAKWELNKYDVQFNTLGGNTLPPILAVPHNTSIEPPDIPIHENHTFEGWYKEQSLENKWNFSTDKITSPITLYAKWKIIPTSVSSSPSSSSPSSSSTPSSSQQTSSSKPPRSSSSKVSSSSSKPQIVTPTPEPPASAPIVAIAPVAASRRPLGTVATSRSASSASSATSSAISSATSGATSGTTDGVEGDDAGTARNINAEAQQSIPNATPQNEGAISPDLSSLNDNKTPLMKLFSSDNWSLVNLMLMLVSAILALIIFIHILISRRKNNVQKDNVHNKRFVTLHVLGISAFPVSLIFFLLTQNLNGDMIFVDISAIIFALLTITQIVFVLLIRRKAQGVETAQSE